MRFGKGIAEQERQVARLGRPRRRLTFPGAQELTFPKVYPLRLSGGFPPIPSRERMQQVRTSGMQNTRNWWECVLTSPDVSREKRLEQYAFKRANGEECQIITLSWRYDPCGYAGRDLWNDIPTLREYVTEALTDGGMSYVLLMLGGDGLDYSADGGTYGFFNLMSNLQRIRDGLAGTNGEGPDLTPYIIPCPGYDGVVPGWAGPQDQWTRVEEYLLHARAVFGPSAVLALELSAGYWCWTESNRYTSPGGQELDIVLYEFPIPFGPVMALPIPADFCNQPDDVRTPYDQCWQPPKRILGSAWRRPSNQPACDDPGMAPDLPWTPRGPIAKIPFETLTYYMVRGQMSPQLLHDVTAYVTSTGWPANWPLSR